jgi:class 3 adenylate cyclase/tetratricopeptide (TPR) repeat protein
MGCGAELGEVCAECGAALPDAARFCIECGAATAGAADADPASPANHGPAASPAGGGVQIAGARRRTADSSATPDPRSYTPRHLADRILKTRGAIEGERKQVTVLFADVKESMDLAEQVDPESWHRILDGFFQLLSTGIHRFEGTINQYTGDGVMALFGAPIAHEDHAHRALYAALHLEQELMRYADDVRRQHGLNFSVRMGLNSGEVIVGKIGDDLRMDYTAQGHTVGLAARVEALAAPNSAYLTEHTAALVSGYFKLRDLGEFSIKGVREPLKVYQLEGAGEARTRLDVSRTRGFSRFVGRDSEMGVLDSAFDEVRNGRSRVVGLFGEAGAGKSRLFYEFLARRRNEGVEILEARCAAHGQMIPYLPVLELLRGYFGISEQDSEQIAREKIAGRILLLDEGMKEMLPHIFDFLGVPDPARPVPPLEPAERRGMLAEGLRKIASRSEDTPMIVVFEDLHWIDGASDTFLADMIGMLDRTCELILVNARPGYQAPWMESDRYDHIALEPLKPQAVADLLRDLLGADPSVTGLADRVAARTGGNPFFVEEVVRSLIDSRILAGDRGAYRLAKPYEMIEIPETVHALLAARIDRLDERDKSVLETAAVIGKDFSERLLGRATDESDESLADALRSLADAGFIDAVRLFPEGEYVFHHPITQEVSYRTQLAERRSAIHRHVAVALENDCCGKSDDNAALLAHHWDGAGEILPAVQWSRRAAQWAATRDLGEAQRHWEKVRELLARCEECPESRSVAIAAREALIEIGWKRGASLERATELYEEGRALAEQTDDKASLSRMISAYAMAELFGGETERGLAHLKEAADVAAQTEDTALHMLLHSRLAYMHLLAGRISDSLCYIGAAIEIVKTEGHAGPGPIVPSSDAVWLEGFRTLPTMYSGDLATAGEDLERIMRLVDPDSDPGSLCTLHGFSVTLAWFRGDVEAGLRHSREQLRIAERLTTPSLMASAWDSASVASSLAGRYEEAVALADRAVNVARTSGTLLQSESVFVANLAAACLGNGEQERAVELGREAVALARRRRTPLFEIRSLLVLARAILAPLTHGEFSGDTTGAAEEVATVLAAAMEIVERTGARGYEPFLREELARLALLRGDAVTAGRELDEARRIFDSFGATSHADRLGASPAASARHSA